MVTIRKSKDRGHANHGWLDSHHTFSFGDYQDPAQMGFRALRVINEDRIVGGSGFAPHGHRDMEIITYVLSGAVEHKDSLGSVGVIRPGDIQRMSAGTGIRHSEYNHYKDQETHFYQIWILPDQPGHAPSYEDKSFGEQLNSGELVLLVSGSGETGSLRANQDFKFYAGRLREGRELRLEDRDYYWLQVARGKIQLKGEILEAGDGVALDHEPGVTFKVLEDAEVLLFDLP